MVPYSLWIYSQWIRLLLQYAAFYLLILMEFKFENICCFFFPTSVLREEIMRNVFLLSLALKWLKCTTRISILWLNKTSNISRGASFWCGRAWSQAEQPSLTERSTTFVSLQETRWDWLENFCNTRTPAAPAHAPSQHITSPKGRRRMGGWVACTLTFDIIQ